MIIPVPEQSIFLLYSAIDIKQDNKRSNTVIVYDLLMANPA